MDAAELKAALLRLLADDLEVRAAVLALVDPVRLKAGFVDAGREDAAAAATMAAPTRRARPPWLER